MGLCQSLYDEDEMRTKEMRKIQAKELQEFRKQLKNQRCQHSELDLQGRGKSRQQSQMPVSQPVCNESKQASHL